MLFRSVCLEISAVTCVVKFSQHLANWCTNAVQKGQLGSINQLESDDNLELWLAHEDPLFPHWQSIQVFIFQHTWGNFFFWLLLLNLNFTSGCWHFGVNNKRRISSKQSNQSESTLKWDCNNTFSSFTFLRLTLF